MKIASQCLVIFVGVIHFWFLILEIFLWKKPLGMKIFRNTAEKAQITSVLAANQGLYNGFLGAGLLLSFFYSDPAVTRSFQLFFLTCVVIAGLYGAFSVSRRIFFVQAFPGILGLFFFLGTN